MSVVLLVALALGKASLLFLFGALFAWAALWMEGR